MAVLWQFGSYNYQTKNVITSQPRQPSVRVRQADTPGRRGGYTQGGLIDTRRITIKGHLVPTGSDVIDTLWDAFVAAHVPGTPQVLYLGRDDRYINAECVGLVDSGTYGDGDEFIGSIPWEVQFAATDPVVYDATLSGPTNVNAGATVTNAGNVETFPTIAVVLSALGTSGTITITNAASGKSMTINMPGALTTLTIDCAAQKITNTGGTDVTNLFKSGSFFGLVAGGNALSKSTTGGANSSAINVTWRNGWWL